MECGQGTEDLSLRCWEIQLRNHSASFGKVMTCSAALVKVGSRITQQSHVAGSRLLDLFPQAPFQF